MTPSQFVAKWKGQTLNEKQAYQQHFMDLCDLVHHGKPADLDKTGDFFCFERGATKTGGGNGWADVWKKGHFAIEYKGPNGSLDKALQQVQRYALALENPPLLVVCDLDTIQIHTNFTNTVCEIHTIALEDIPLPANLEKLRWLFNDPDKLRPRRSIDEITSDAADRIAQIATKLSGEGHDTFVVAHFLNQCVFCCFAEDVGLLPERLFTRLLETSLKRPEALPKRLESLFEAMAKGDVFGEHDILWFNGGLFADIHVLPLSSEIVEALLSASRLDWSHINPSIFGTLFERGLDPAKRSQLGAHYTDVDSILRILSPVIAVPLLVEWSITKDVIKSSLEKWHKGGKGSKTAKGDADAAYYGFLEKLRHFRVLDPACGSGNFLYLALKMLKDIQHRVMLEAEEMGLMMDLASLVGPETVMGLEINPYAAELARVTVWIGEIQWMIDHGYQPSKNPVLKSLNLIDNRDALLNTDGSESLWPACDVIVGNPPFLGGNKKSGELGRGYFESLNRVYEPHVVGGADLVCYWFHKSLQLIKSNQCKRAGLVTTQSIRNGSNRKVLDAIVEHTAIFNAWSDEAWVNEGAAVRVSLISFGLSTSVPLLDNKPVARINADLTAGGEKSVDLTVAQKIFSNRGVAFQGSQKIGAFDISGNLAREMLLNSGNPNGKPNSDVIKPNYNGLDVVQNKRDVWIIDFGLSMSESDAALYEKPFQIVESIVKPERLKNNRETYRKYWWRHGEGRVAMRAAISKMLRYCVTVETAKYRCFAWLDSAILPDKKLIVIAKADDTSFGLLHSRIHEVWSLAMGSMHGKGNDPRYTPSTTFETFPFPQGLTPADTINCTVSVDGLVIPVVAEQCTAIATEIAKAAFELNRLRENWLNPIEWIERAPEVVAGYPDRIIPKSGFEAQLKKRTLTNLYNERPAWLMCCHEKLDSAVAKAYGWTDYSPAMADDEILRRLLALNLERSNGG